MLHNSTPCLGRGFLLEEHARAIVADQARRPPPGDVRVSVYCCSMSKKNLTQQRSAIRWILSYHLLALLATLVAWSATVALLRYDWNSVGAWRDVTQYFAWQPDLRYAVDVANATAGWLSLYLVLVIAWNVRKLYGLMGLSMLEDEAPRVLQKTQKAPARGYRKPVSRKA